MTDYTNSPTPNDAAQYDGDYPLPPTPLGDYRNLANNIFSFGSFTVDDQVLQFETLAARFLRLKQQWETQTINSSSFDDMISHPAYQEIISIGPSVVPMLLADLRNSPNHWFYALRKITGESPIPKSAAGDLEGMTRAWLDWGKRHGY